MQFRALRIVSSYTTMATARHCKWTAPARGSIYVSTDNRHYKIENNC